MSNSKQSLQQSFSGEHKYLYKTKGQSIQQMFWSVTNDCGRLLLLLYK